LTALAEAGNVLLMPGLRRLLAPLAAFWLCSQIGVLVFVPVALWAAADQRSAACTCGHGPHGLCPMHHAPDRTSRCAMQATDGSHAAIVTGLIALTGFPPDITPATDPVPDSTAVRSADDRFVGERPIPPDPPPPRV
jgi:hypothetical protein